MAAIRTWALLGAAWLIGAATLASADDDVPGPDWILIEQAAQALRFAGYTTILELEAEDGRWKGKAIRGGLLYEVHVDPHTGAVVERRRGRRDDDD